MSLACFRSLLAAGWSLLLCDCWLVTCSGTLFELRGGFWRGLGGLLDGSGRARAGARMAHESPGSDFRELPESIPRALQSSSNPLRRSWQADDALSLVFPCFWALCPFEVMFSHTFGPSDALARRLCCQIVQRRVRDEHLFWVFHRV